ncbi:Oxygen-independent coproporphyrinogen-III oxidase [Rothia kristinae]|nr:Oxygen-independent coproporphyrinogen-III oxidase [Rothia kristinae]
MSPAQPTGDPAPSDGLLPASVLDGAERRSLSLYVHVPYCSVRCGYCDFNTYAAEDFGDGVNRLSYAEDAIRELDLAAGVLTRSGLPARPLSTVFFGGGTPTRLPAEDLARILRAGIERFGIVDGAEVTTEANPDSVTREDLALLKEAGFTRVSFGMQSAVPRVLAVLDRTHTPANVPKVVSWAREVGLQTSVDLISGAPGETLAEWETSVRAAIDCAPDHISAYSLIVEPGTKLAAQIRRGELSPVDDDAQADMYLLADRLFGRPGTPGTRCPTGPAPRTPAPGTISRTGATGTGGGSAPGALAHQRRALVESEAPRALRPSRASGPVPGGGSGAPGCGHPLRRGRDARRAHPGGRRDRGSAGPGREAVGWLEGQGLIEPQARAEGRVVLTLRGRLLGDAVVRTLLGD